MDKKLSKAVHCIGMDRKRPYTRHGKMFYRPYRNYYSTGKVDEDWEELVSEGYAKRGDENQHGGYTFWLTRAGLDWVGNELEIHIWDEET